MKTETKLKLALVGQVLGPITALVGTCITNMGRIDVGNGWYLVGDLHHMAIGGPIILLGVVITMLSLLVIMRCIKEL